MSRCPFATWRPGPPHKVGYGALTLSVKDGVIDHSAEGPLSATLDVLDSSRQVSWHFTNDDTGLYQHYDTDAVCWHAGYNANVRFVGVENTGVAGEWLTDNQLDHLIDLHMWLKDEGILTECKRAVDLWEHNEWMATDCPSGRIPWSWLIVQLKEEEEPMSTEDRDEAVAMLDDATTSLGIVREIMLEKWPVGPPPASGKTINLVLVTYFNQPPWKDYYNALWKVPAQIDTWLRPQGLEVNAWGLEHVALPGNPGSYNLLSIVKAVQEVLGESVPNEDEALYIFSQDPEGALVVYGTLGGDWFGGPQFPGVSYFMIPGLHALAYDTDHPEVGKDDGWHRDKALGAIAHELGHNLCGLPCANAPHKDICVMKRWSDFPDNVYEKTGYIFTPDPPPFAMGNEREAMIASGFMREV